MLKTWRLQASETSVLVGAEAARGKHIYMTFLLHTLAQLATPYTNPHPVSPNALPFAGTMVAAPRRTYVRYTIAHRVRCVEAYHAMGCNARAAARWLMKH